MTDTTCLVYLLWELHVLMLDKKLSIFPLVISKFSITGDLMYITRANDGILDKLWESLWSKRLINAMQDEKVHFM